MAKNLKGTEFIRKNRANTAVYKNLNDGKPFQNKKCLVFS